MPSPDDVLDRRRHTSGRLNGDAAPIRLLIADDDPNYRAFLVALARRLGFGVETAVDGEDAIEHLAHAQFDVAIIDYEMPRMTGMSVIARMRLDETARGVYALMLTSREDVDTKVTALESGFDDFVAKSATDRELIAKLNAARRLAMRQRALHSTVRELDGLASRDELTNVFNRRIFFAETERLLDAHALVSLVLLDLDDFKHINDTFGHLAGDQVLRDIAALFQSTTRPEDLIARFGGDEFVMLVDGLIPADVERLATRLAKEVSALQWLADETMFSISATTGIASVHLLPGATLEQLLEAADRDLYKNKWVRDHPELRPELYEYTPVASRVDLIRARR
ncbi:MAG TPA: diguanylate cyclase [Thermoanaerobaculia bacterium]|nr:diguanylate cyclase [Thermoanaerobaculia bacterium]